MPPKQSRRQKNFPIDEDPELQEALRQSMAIQQEEEERRRKLEEEARRRIQEEERMRKEQERLRIEEQRALEEAEEKAKAEIVAAERKKRLEEQVHKKLQAEKEKETQRHKESEAKRKQQLEEEERRAQAKSPAPVEVKRDIEIDLLGGLTDEEDEVALPSHARDEGEHLVAHKVVRHHLEREQDGSVYSNGSLNGSGSMDQRHREINQRGPLDAIADDFFDRIVSGVIVKKSTKNDGVYLFGARIIRLKLMNGELHVAVTPRNIIPLREFVQKFEKVELVRAKGLQAGLNLCSMLQSNPTKGLTVQ